MLEHLFTPAFFVASSLGIACAVLSVFVVLRRWSFIGEGIAHASFGGAGTAWLLALLFPAIEQSNWPYVATLVVLFCFATAMMIGGITRRQQVQPDAAIGIFLVASLAWGFVAQSIYFHFRHAIPAGWDTFLFGQMQDLSMQFAAGVMLMSVAVVGTVVMLGKEMVYCAFDPTMAEASGVRAGFIHYLLLGLLAMMIVIGVRVAGSVLIPALLILPGTTALLLSRKLGNVFALAVAAGLIGALGGWAVNMRWQFISVGPAIVLTLFVLFVAALAVKRIR